MRYFSEIVDFLKLLIIVSDPFYDDPFLYNFHHIFQFLR
jgi:hypothetical protein